MKLSVIFSVLGLLSAATAAPIHTPAKRALPRLGGLNIAVSLTGVEGARVLGDEPRTDSLAMAAWTPRCHAAWNALRLISRFGLDSTDSRAATSA